MAIENIISAIRQDYPNSIMPDIIAIYAAIEDLKRGDAALKAAMDACK